MTWLSKDNGHEFVEVGNRRWCVTCTLFQQRSHKGFPPPLLPCPRSTPYAAWLEKKQSGQEENDEKYG
jgi:hypothetical protein